MLIEKICNGVLAVQTDEDTFRYLRPSLADRIELLWMFRNFRWLPHKVLRPRQLTLVSRLLESGKFQANGDCRIGTVEWPPKDTVEWSPKDTSPAPKPAIPPAVQAVASTPRVPPATSEQRPFSPHHRGKRRRRRMRAG